MMTKNAYAFVVIEEKVMAFKHAKDKGLVPIFEGFVPLKEGFLKNFKERCNLEFLESLVRGQEFEKNLEDLMPSSLGVHSYDESLNLAKKHCIKNCKKALQDFTEKIKKSPNDLNAMNEAFNHLKTKHCVKNCA